jgi:plasmid stability protein
MKRTTLKIDESVLRRLKQRAAAEGRSMQDLANQLLRRALADQSRPRYRLALTGWEAVEQPGVDLLDRDKLFGLMGDR